MAFLGGSVSVFALRWAVGFLGNISQPRDMGFNARVTATVMLTGIGPWHLSPGPARPDLLTYVVEYGERLAALSALHGLSIGCAGNMPEPRSTILTHAAVLRMGLTAPFGSHVLRQYLSGPESVTPTGRFVDQVLAGVEPPGISTAARGLDLVCSVAPSHTITNYDSCLRQTVTGVRK